MVNGHSGFRRGGWVLVAGAGLLGAGCVGSPTYGTGVSANQQLVNDVSNILSVGPKPRQEIAYQPRPELVKPSPAEAANAALPAPQQKMASAENPDWPESPEERRARIRASATANQDDPFYQPEVAGDGAAMPAARGRDIGFRARDAAMNTPGETRQKREAFNAGLAERNQGSSTTRKYLSEPPLAYRQPSDAAPQNDIGEDEWKKEKRLKAEARKKSGKSGWFDWLPGT